MESVGVCFPGTALRPAPPDRLRLLEYRLPLVGIVLEVEEVRLDMGEEGVVPWEEVEIGEGVARAVRDEVKEPGAKTNGTKGVGMPSILERTFGIVWMLEMSYPPIHREGLVPLMW